MAEFESVVDYLPETITSIISVIGFAETEKLVKELGGTMFYFCEGATYFSKLKSVLGTENATKLRQHLRGCAAVYIPRCDVALRLLRNQRFFAEFESLTQQEGKSARLTMVELCPKYGITDRRAWEIVKQFRQQKTLAQQGGLWR